MDWHSMDEILKHAWVASIKEATLSEMTKSQYVRQLVKLTELAGGRSLGTIITHPKAMKSRINKAHVNMQTRKALISAVRALFKYNPPLQTQYPDENKEWQEIARDVSDAILKRVATAQPTEREVLNWVPWQDVMKKQHELAKTSYGSVEHLTLSMYTLMEPMRSDFGQLKIYVDTKPSPENSENSIYLSPHPGNSTITLHHYKTSTKYGTFRRNIPDDLVNVLLKSLELHPREYVFVQEDGISPYRVRNTYTKFVNRILESIFKKRMTVSLLRHSFISGLDFNEKTPGELMKHSDNMMHSIAMQQLYRRKVPSLNVVKTGTDDDDIVLIRPTN